MNFFYAHASVCRYTRTVLVLHGRSEREGWIDPLFLQPVFQELI